MVVLSIRKISINLTNVERIELIMRNKRRKNVKTNRKIEEFSKSMRLLYNFSFWL